MKRSLPVLAHLVFLPVLMTSIPSRAAEANQPTRLTDGMPFSVRGKLQIKFRGWASYLVVALDHRYLADFGGSEPVLPVTTVELRSAGNWKRLTPHIGEDVQAEGKLQIDPASPYYWNGVILMAATVQLADGTILRPEAFKAAILPSNLERYVVTVTMLPNTVNWPHQAVDLDTGKQVPGEDLDGCALNGGGDVLNCGCVEGFRPVRAAVVAHSHGPADWRSLPMPDMIDSNTAQLGLPDADATSRQTYQVVCERRSTIPR